MLLGFKRLCRSSEIMTESCRGVCIHGSLCHFCFEFALVFWCSQWQWCHANSVSSCQCLFRGVLRVVIGFRVVTRLLLFQFPLILVHFYTLAYVFSFKHVYIGRLTCQTPCLWSLRWWTVPVVQSLDESLHPLLRSERSLQSCWDNCSINQKYLGKQSTRLWK